MVIAESPLGTKTANYYDKNSGRLLMIIYENHHKTVIVKHYKQKGISVPLLLLEGDADSINKDFTLRLDDDRVMDSNWFHIPAAGICQPPDIFRTGDFSCFYENSMFTMTRTADKQSETKKNTTLDYKLEWTSGSDYLIFRLKNPAAPPDNSNIEYHKCRIINWNGSKAYCQSIGSEQVEGTFVIQKDN